MVWQTRVCLTAVVQRRAGGPAVGSGRLVRDQARRPAGVACSGPPGGRRCPSPGAARPSRAGLLGGRGECAEERASLAPRARLVGSAPRLPALCCPLSVAGPGLGAAGWTAWLALGGDVGARVRGSGSQTCAFGPALAPPGLRRCHWGGSSLLGPESPSPSAGETLLAPAVCGHLFPQLRGRLVLETPCVCVSVRAAGLQGQAAGCGLWNRRANLAGVLRASSGPRRKTVARLSQCRSDSTRELCGCTCPPWRRAEPAGRQETCRFCGCCHREAQTS